MCIRDSTWEETEYVPFEWTFDGVNSSYTAGTQVRVTLDTMRNPVSGAETEATLSLPSGLISKTIHTTSTKAFAIFSKGLKMAAPALLEPVMRASIFVPESDTGEVMGDLNGRRAKILGMSPQDDGTTLVEVEVPQAEMLRYATELRSQTQGRGTFTMVFDHYDQVPGHLVQDIVDAKDRREAEDSKA